MPKWAIGCLVLLVVTVGALVWFVVRQYKSFTSAGPSASVLIGAPPGRVFASIANVDSLPTWRTMAVVRSTRKGMLQVGDTLIVRSRLPTDTVDRESTEIVAFLIPDQLVVLEARDSTGVTVMARRDSLVAHGDSTEVVSTFILPIADSARARVDTGKRSERTMLEVAANLMIGVARMQFGQELRRLKARIEGTAPPPSSSPSRPPPPPRPPSP